MKYFQLIIIIVQYILLLLPSTPNAEIDEVECEIDGTCQKLQQQQSNDNDTTNNNDNESDNNKCGLYLAVSAIPNSGLGMYTTKAIQDGERIFYSDLVIQAEDPAVNLRLLRLLKNNVTKNDKKRYRSWLLKNYYWNPSNTFGDYEANEVQSIIPGLGMLANSHTGLMNCDIRKPIITYQYHRNKDPATGALTNFHDLHFNAVGDIIPGSELFVEYGDTWFEDRTELGLIPLSKDFKKADDIINAMMNMTTLSNNDELTSNVIDLIRQTASYRPRLVNAIPDNIDKLREASQFGTAALSVPNRIRSIEWLETNGICLDNIRPDKSTIPQAGYGAFATRTIKSGHIIAPLPLVHLQRYHFDVYGADDVDDPKTDVWFEGYQLLFNYVYGHPKSSLLFFPYSPIVNYINHNITQANVVIRWSNISSSSQSWLEKTPTSIMDEEKHAGLVMELVATKDIESNDEIFLNYGILWEISWNQHVKNWKPEDDETTSYIPAAELNNRSEWLTTKEERDASEETPLYNDDSASIITTCFVGNHLQQIADDDDDDDEEKNKNRRPRFNWKYSKDLYESSSYRYTCEILEREYDTDDEDDETENYDDHSKIRYIVIVQKDDDNEIIVENIPREAIQFVDKQYQSDLCLRNSFRHIINLPDAMVPKIWRDL